MSLGTTIPKRIIQIWGDGEEALPMAAKAAVANVRLLNPDFEYLFFDDEGIRRFIAEHFPQHRQLFDSFPRRITRYDFFRYLAVFHYGGFYLDMDVFLVSGLSGLLGYGCVFPFEELTIYEFLRSRYAMDWGIGNYAFGAAAGHPFLAAVIGNCVKAQLNPKWRSEMTRSIPAIFRANFDIFCASGPGLVSRTLAEFPGAAEQVKVLFQDDVCDVTKWFRFGEYGIHLMNGTWLERRSAVRRRLFSIWCAWTEKRFRRESVKLGASRTLEFRKQQTADGKA